MSTLPRVLVSALVALALVGMREFGCRHQADGRHSGRRRRRGVCSARRSGKGRGRLVATSVGTLLGAFLGNEAGKSLDRADALHVSQAEYQALEYTPSGQATAWRNPDTGHYGNITPIETYETASGAYCREFQHQAQIGGRTRAVYGTACRTPDGEWQVVN